MVGMLSVVSVAMFMAVRMPVFVVLVVPVPSIVVPAITVPVVVRMTPISAGIGWLFVAAGNPAIMMPLRRPEPAYPYHRGRGGWWRGRFIRNRRWRPYSDGNRNLTYGRQDERDAEQKPISGSNFHSLSPFCVNRAQLDGRGVWVGIHTCIHTT